MIRRAERERWREILPTSEVGKALDAADALREGLAEVWASVPGTYNEADPMVKRHAAALNAIRLLLARYDAAVEPQP